MRNIKAQYTSMKSSRSVRSRSSKLTKQNAQKQPKKSVSPYFQEDPIRTQIMARINSRGKNPEKQKGDHLQKAASIIDDLMVRHRKAKEKLQKMKDQSERDYEKLHTFTPKCSSNNQRYAVKGDVIRRNQIWLRQKKRRTIQLKEQVTIQDLRQCTFSPTFKSKKQSQHYLKNRQASRSITPSSKALLQRPLNTYSPKNISKGFKSPKQFPKKRDYTQAEYATAKQNLISRMMNIAY